MKAILINGTYKAYPSIPKTWGNRLNFDKHSPEVHLAVGFKDLVEPVFDLSTHKRTNKIIDHPEDETKCTYETLPLTQAEIDEKNKVYVPQQVKNMKLRLALIQSGISIANIEAGIAAIPDQATKEMINTMWEYAEYYERDNTQLIGMAAQLGITDEQLDQLFIYAETL